MEMQVLLQLAGWFFTTSTTWQALRALVLIVYNLLYYCDSGCESLSVFKCLESLFFFFFSFNFVLCTVNYSCFKYLVAVLCKFLLESDETTNGHQQPLKVNPFQKWKSSFTTKLNSLY